MTIDLICSQSCKVISEDVENLPFSLAYLHEIIINNSKTYNMGAIMTEWRHFCPEFKHIAGLASKVLKSFGGNHEATNLNKIGEDIKYNNLIQHCNSSEYALELNSLWAQYYPIGAFQSSHCHLPCHWSFVFFVNSPKGSSPLVFGEEDLCIEATPGKMVIFPSWIRHHVPHNNGENRSIVAGNFMYLPKYLVEKRPLSRIIYLS
jgi:hypothetical protein